MTPETRTLLRSWLDAQGPMPPPTRHPLVPISHYGDPGDIGLSQLGPDVPDDRVWVVADERDREADWLERPGPQPWNAGITPSRPRAKPTMESGIEVERLKTANASLTSAIIALESKVAALEAVPRWDDAQIAAIMAKMNALAQRVRLLERPKSK